MGGKSRTGKSFLLNKILETSKGFKVDPLVNSCTKGIWLYSKPLYNPLTETNIFLIGKQKLKI
jgi:hypothetical protein